VARLLVAIAILLPACESSTTTSSSSSSGDSCDDLLNQEGLGTVTFTVENQRAEPVILPSGFANERPPLMEATFGSVSAAPTFPPGHCASTCEGGMPDGLGWGCTSEWLVFHYIEPGAAVSFDWSGIYIEEASLPEACAMNSHYVGPCNVERPVPAGEVTFTLHLLSNVDPSLATHCEDGSCGMWVENLEGDEETLTTSLTFDASGSQSHTVTVD